jgi:DNA-binding NarL/FixJ family response regulator
MNVVRRVAVQQRQRLFRSGIGELLAVEIDVEVVGTVATGDDLAGICDQERPDIALMEVDVIDWDPCRLAARLARGLSSVRLVGLYGSRPSVTNLRALRSLGLTVLCRGEGMGPILEHLRAPQRAGSGPSRPRFTRASWDARSESQGLTPRETTILESVGGGWTSRQTSEMLHISPKTVENHKQRIFAKLGVQNQAHAVSVAMRRGLIRPEGPVDIAAAGRR